MSKSNQISEDIARLHRELEQAGPIDTELRESLKKLDEDIHRLLEKPDTESLELDQPIEDQLDAIAIGFAARHPQLNAFLRELADTLARMGI